MAGKEGMETEIRENVDIFCKVAGYFINGLFYKAVVVGFTEGKV